MECNKDEAIKARDIAVKKLENNDFEGAHKFLEKSKRIYPDIENITYLQAVCDVHIAAQIRLFITEKDWYSILQVEKIADDVAIKKQYRKLALVLHPDKNTYPGAEAAFKLIGEANMVLSDKGKRSVYDMKIRANVKPPARAPTRRNPSVKKQQPKTSNTVPIAPTQVKPNPNISFWTRCPFCTIRYQYNREYVNRALRCQNCSKAFVAQDIGGSNGRHRPPKQQASFKVDLKSYFKPVDVKCSQQNAKPYPPAQVKVDPVYPPKQQASFKVDIKSYFKPVDVKRSQQNAMPYPPTNVNADPVLPTEADNLKNSSKKRGRKVVNESSETEDMVEESRPESASNSKKIRSFLQKQVF